MSDILSVPPIARPILAEPLPGLTPAQVALAAAPARPPPDIPATEQRLYDLFDLVERYLPPELSGRYGALLQDIAEDQTYDGISYLGLMRAPAQHTAPWLAFEGALLAQVHRQWRIWQQSRDGDAPDGSMAAEWAELLGDCDVTDAHLLQGIIHNALPRGWAHYVQLSGQDWAVDLGQHESSQLLCSGAKSLLLLQQRDILLDGQLMHLLLPASGLCQGYRSPLARVYAAIERASCTSPDAGA